MKKQHYMRHDERQQLEALYKAKIPIAQIARQLGFCRQTIYNELKTGSYEHERHGFLQKRYSANRADSIHEENQTAKGRPLKIGSDREYADYLEMMMLGNGDRRKRYSPAAALAAAEKKNFVTAICVNTLYSYITKRVFRRLTNQDLWQKSKKKKRGYQPVRRIAHPELPSIINRPDYINSREEPGHMEMDLVVSCEKGKGAILTLTERTTRREIIRKIPNRKAESIQKELDELERQTPRFRELCKSITTDNGSEFLKYKDLKTSIHGGERFEIYYCHSYAAWEKGSNENHNRMIRRWFPKGTDFSRISKKELAECQDWMNNYPRKILGWLTPNELSNLIAA
ncbi:MAG: IS30 family transposase [Oscillospiraceae bacterium]